MLSHRKRLENCFSQGKLDHVPVALWRHFPVDDQSAETLARATLAFQYSFDFDLVKVTPQSAYCIQDWGAEEEWLGSTEGTYTYTKRVIQQPDDWLKLTPLNPKAGRLGSQLRCLELIRKKLGDDTPFVQTIFNPLSQAKNLAGNDRLLVHLRKYPDAVMAGLNTIAESILRFVEEAKKTGIAGIFYAVQHAQYGLLTREEYQRFGKVFDTSILDITRDLWLNLVHLHGLDVMYDLFTDLPIQVINWHDRETEPSLQKALSMFPGAVCGGLQREKTLVLGSPEQITREAKQAITESGGVRFILGTGCVVPITAPYGNLLAARQSVEHT